MAIDKSVKSVKRFGSRYGRTLRHKLGKIESEQKKSYKCPYCKQEKVKRSFLGVWQCKKCNAKFTGKAYSIRKKIIIRETTE